MIKVKPIKKTPPSAAFQYLHAAFITERAINLSQYMSEHKEIRQKDVDDLMEELKFYSVKFYTDPEGVTHSWNPRIKPHRENPETWKINC